MTETTQNMDSVELWTPYRLPALPSAFALLLPGTATCPCPPLYLPTWQQANAHAATLTFNLPTMPTCPYVGDSSFLGSGKPALWLFGAALSDGTCLHRTLLTLAFGSGRGRR